MIDWVMSPRMAVALYIYRVGRSCLARNPFHNLKSARTPQFCSDSRSSSQTVRPTGQIGVAITGSATRRHNGQTVEGYRSDRWRQPDRPCA
jgi:hypothetical protein